MQELDHSGVALPLFGRLAYNLVPVAAVDGMAAGRFFADSAREPRLATFWDGTHGLYLAGDPPDEEGIAAITRLLRETVLPGALPPCLIVHYPTEPAGQWRDTMASAILPDLGAVAAPRIIYTLRRSEPPGQLAMPPGIRLVDVDAGFFRRNDLADTASLHEWLGEVWASLDAYAERGFGVGLLSGERVVGWCMAEYVSGGRCGIGIETHPDYRNRGLARSMATAFVERAFARGLVPHWDCWARNVPSAAVAERIGYTQKTEYSVFWVPVGG